MGALAPFNEVPEFAQTGAEIDLLLRFADRTTSTPELSALAAPKSGEAASEAEEETSYADAVNDAEAAMVEVRLKHAASGSEVRVTVPQRASMLDVREAAAKELGRKDNERLGNRRRLLLMGVELAPTIETPDVVREGSMDASRKAPLTLREASSLQNELREGFSQEPFQKQLKELRRRFPKNNTDFLRERSKLFLTVQSEILPKYGFEGNIRGVVTMMDALNPFNDNAEFAQNGQEISQLLGLDQSAGDVSEPEAVEDASEPEDVRALPHSATTSTDLVELEDVVVRLRQPHDSSIARRF